MSAETAVNLFLTLVNCVILYAIHFAFDKHINAMKEHREYLVVEDIQCPVCGYYCLGKGGHGCIDKPSLMAEELK